MGRQALAFFTDAEKIAGMHGKLQLAGLVKMTSAQAASMEDTPELVRLFERALATLKAQTQAAKPQDASDVSEAKVVPGDPKLLRKHIQVFTDFMTQKSLVLRSLSETARRVNEAAAETLDIARVSIWFLDEKRTKITCTDLYERNLRKHSSGTELFAKDFPAYFRALETERTIAAHDAHTDSRTSVFSAPYLKPLGINSMLDVPIWVNGKMLGVICHEHVGPARTWNTDEEQFGYLMAGFVSLAVEKDAPTV